LTDVVIVRSNFIVYDTGLVRIIRSLSKRYSTVAFGWNREGRRSYDIDNLKKEILGKTSNRSIGLKILKINAPIRESLLRNYLPLIVFLPIFWTWIFIYLVIYKPKIVHACDLDTVIPCYLYKKIFRKKMVFYIFDRFALTYIPKKFKMLYRTVHNIEEYCSNGSDTLITVGKKVLDTFERKPKCCAIILNSPEDYNLENKENCEDKSFRIVYGGHIMPDRGLENICSAITDLSNVEFYIYGPVIDKKLLGEIVSIPNVKYQGYLTSSHEYYKSIMKADAMIAVYSPNVESFSITMHNKTYEAMMCGIPLITNLSPEFVKDTGFGIIVEYNNIDEIRSAIISLKEDPELCKKLGKNGRKAYLEKYSWKEEEKELYRIYDYLLARM
jgi:glycosyltransferase involved in cell wall biosynthesis